MGEFCKQCGKELFTDFSEINKAIKRMQNRRTSNDSTLPKGAKIYAYPCRYHKGAKHLTSKPPRAKRTKGRKEDAVKKTIMEELSI